MRRTLSIILKELYPYMGFLCSILLLVIVIVVIDATLPWFYKMLLDDVLGGESIRATGIWKKFIDSFGSLGALAGFIVSIFLLGYILRSFMVYLKRFLTRLVSNKFIIGFSERIFMHSATHESLSDAEYAYMLTDKLSVISELLENGIIPLIGSIFYFGLIIFIMYFISSELLLVSLFVMPFLVASLYLFNKRLVSKGKRSADFNYSIFSFMYHSFYSRHIRHIHHEDTKRTKFMKLIHTSLAAELGLYKMDILLDALVGMAFAVSFTSVMAYGSRAVFAGQISLGLFWVYLCYIDTFTEPLLTIADSITSIRNASRDIKKLSPLLKPVVES